MPVCTRCTIYVPYLYTVYDSAFNLRLELCPQCNAFADPYVEHDGFSLLLDIILLKREVYRHLLYNRSSRPRYITHNPNEENHNSEAPSLEMAKRRWGTVFRLGCFTVLVDSFIRWSRAYPFTASRQSNSDPLVGFISAVALCLVDTFAFHAGVTLYAMVALQISTAKENKMIKSREPRTEPVQVSLVLLYSSIAKLFLLFLLCVWDAGGHGTSKLAEEQTSRLHLLLPDFDVVDREWVIRSILGGMSAGFGLRVILDCHPVVMTGIILLGWATKACVASLLHPWLCRAGNSTVLLEYSTPL